MCNKKNLVFKTSGDLDERVVNVHCYGEDRSPTNIDVINPMIKYDSQIGWGYEGGGPDTLTILLMEIMWGKKPEDVIGSKYYSKSFDNLLEYISKYDKDSDTFEISGADILNMFVRPDIETYKFDVLRYWLDNVIDFADTNGLHSADKMHTLLRVDMPYYITISNEKVTITNRDYHELGVINGALLDRGGVPAVYITMSEETVAEILGGYNTISVYFYDDSCKPWESKKNLITYLDKLDSIIGKLTGVNIKRPIFIK